MFSYHRFKRSRWRKNRSDVWMKEWSFSGALAEPIPVHPDANYRAQHRPAPPPSPHPAAIAPAAAKVVAAPVAAAPMAAGTAAGGFSPWWILGPLLALVAALALGILAYTMKKKHDEDQNGEDKSKRNPTGDQRENQDQRQERSQPKPKLPDSQWWCHCKMYSTLRDRGPITSVESHRSFEILAICSSWPRRTENPSENGFIAKIFLETGKSDHILGSFTVEIIERQSTASRTEETPRNREIISKEEQNGRSSSQSTSLFVTNDFRWNGRRVLSFSLCVIVHPDPKRFAQSTGKNELSSPLHDKSQNDDLSSNYLAR